MGPEVAELEAALAGFTGSQALHHRGQRHRSAADRLMALDLKPGDEVITTPFTFAATAEMIVLAGASRCLWTSSPTPATSTPALIEAKDHIAHPGHHAGEPVRTGGRHGAINAMAARHGLAVIEDAAQSFGAVYQGGAPARCPPSAPPASSPASRWAAMATAARSSPTTTAWRRPRARSACTARAALPPTRAGRGRAHGHAAVRGGAGQAGAL
jgi:hypothetical protein